MGMIRLGNPTARRPATRRKRIEAIEMQSKRFGYFPRTFLWRGHRYDVHAVERCWTTGMRQSHQKTGTVPWGGRVQRHYFRVRCAEGAFELFQDVIHNTWHVAHFEPAA